MAQYTNFAYSILFPTELEIELGSAGAEGAAAPTSPGAAYPWPQVAEVGYICIFARYL